MKIVDIRLSAMARAFGGYYTRYADDLTVSWKVPTKGVVIDSMYRCAGLVLEEYHVELNPDKKRVMGPGIRQDIVGLCINSGRPTITQHYRRNVRAAIHNEQVRGSNRLKTGKRKPAWGERYDGPIPSLERQQMLRGKISYIASIHHAEAMDLHWKLDTASQIRTRQTEKNHAEEHLEIEFEAGIRIPGRSEVSMEGID